MGYFNRDNNSDSRRGGGRSFGGGGGRNFGPRSFGRSGGGSSDRTMFKTTCSECGNDCEVPFRPTNGKPVYCSSCFEKMGNQRSDSGRPERSYDRSNDRPQAFDSNKALLESINQKLDKMLALLSPKTEEKKADLPLEKVVEEVKEVKKAAPKTKKAVTSKKK